MVSFRALWQETRCELTSARLQRSLLLLCDHVDLVQNRDELDRDKRGRLRSCELKFGDGLADGANEGR
jgi:hypothetical protein